MTTSRDVAEFLLEQHGLMDTWKLQKLVFYIQAWHLADHNKPAFDDEIQAFVDGPVARDLFAAHQNLKFVRQIWKGDASQVAPSVRETADAVWAAFGDETGTALRELSHAEPAWVQARAGLDPNEPSDRPLSHEAMAKSARLYREALASLPRPQPEETIDDYLHRVAAGD